MVDIVLNTGDCLDRDVKQVVKRIVMQRGPRSGGNHRKLPTRMGRGSR